MKHLVENNIVDIDGQILGFGRAMTDGVFNAAIYDVIVHLGFQKQGIAKQSCFEMVTEVNQQIVCQYFSIKFLKIA
ncbi:GNAT family N-acetyltransferase [Neobacillus cucumis]|uniref:GNAT family N-acetyltransferase n=1 Tax=Neobacillus cucumis TaxID=1740721 RepID=UPI0035B518A0